MTARGAKGCDAALNISCISDRFPFSIRGAFTLAVTVFAWIFTAWALLGITPLYLYVVRGLENAKFVQGDMDAMDSSRANLTACAPQEERAPPSGNKTSQTETQGYNTGTYDTDQYNTGNYHNAHKHSYTQQRIASSGDDVERNMATKQL